MEHKIKIPLTDLVIAHEELQKELQKAFEAVVSGGIFNKGPFLDDFEKRFAHYVGAKYCIGVASGTDALHLSLRVLGIGPGDEVIMPANTFIASVYATLFVGAKPILVDINPDTYTIDTQDLERKITKRTKVIIPVDLYGQSVEMDVIQKIAKKHRLLIVDDACQAHGATYQNRPVGSMATLSTFSFYATKNLGALGDAGAITTNSKHLALKLKQLREYGEISRYKYTSIGINSRLDALQAAFLSVKLTHLPEWNNKRKELALYYDKQFSFQLPFITLPPKIKNATHVYHLYVIRTKKRDKLRDYLLTKGIQTGIHYPIPLHLQKSLIQLGYKKGDFPQTEKIAKEILSIPIYPQLTRTQQDYIIDSISTFFKKF